MFDTKEMPTPTDTEDSSGLLFRFDVSTTRIMTRMSVYFGDVEAGQKITTMFGCAEVLVPTPILIPLLKEFGVMALDFQGCALALDPSGLEHLPLEVLAQAAHEINRVWCLSMGDSSQPHWEDAPEWQRLSCLDGVKGVLKGNGPRESHENWLRLKEVEGWKYGPIKDPSNKEHPCFVPYEELPEAQKAKDDLFVWTVRKLYGKLTAATKKEDQPNS